MFKRFCAAALVSVLGATSANATIVTVFDGVVAGTANFINTVNAAGGAAQADQLSGIGSGLTSVDRGAYTISQNDGSTLTFESYGQLTGQTIDIDPYGASPGIGGFDSGLTFVFDNPVNAIGFEVGDWATCCLPSALYISFDGGSPILVANADDNSDGLFPTPAGFDDFEIFVAAFDDTGSFTSVSFWGDGYGEVLNAGGTIRYALLDEGSLPPPSTVPVPAAALLLASGVAGIGALRRFRPRA